MFSVILLSTFKVIERVILRRKKMVNYNCDTCDKSYKYKRNLRRHVEEKHMEIELWNCTVDKCKVTFKRRGYLYTHLQKVHGYTSNFARRQALLAKRGNDNGKSTTSYYEDVSEDDTILDLLQDGLPSSDNDDVSSESSTSSSSDDSSSSSSDDVTSSNESSTSSSSDDTSSISSSGNNSSYQAANVSQKPAFSDISNESDVFSDHVSSVAADNSETRKCSSVESVMNEVASSASNTVHSDHNSLAGDINDIPECEFNVSVSAGASECEESDDNMECSNGMNEVSDDINDSVVVISDDDLVAPIDSSITRVTHYMVFSFERTFIYRNGEIISTENNMCRDEWVSNN